MSAQPPVTIPQRLRMHAAPATPHQRQYIRVLYRYLGLDTKYVTLMHEGYFVSAGLGAPEPGTQLDAALCALTKAQASALVATIKEDLPDVRDRRDGIALG